MPSKFIVDGKEVYLYKIGEVAKAVHKSTKTIRRWEKLGLLPKATFKSRGNRVYSEEQLKNIVAWKKGHSMRQGYRIAKTKPIVFQNSTG